MRKLLFGASAVLLACSIRLAAYAAPASVPGFSYVKSMGGIDEYALTANDLHVLLYPSHAAPVVTFQVTYRVGSRNESTGSTGATHLLEHLMFKGSEHFNDVAGNSIKQFIGRVGGENNANTSYDRTTYFATVGRESLQDYMAIEADRMRNLWLHAEDKQAEMTVVRNEYERGENDPSRALFKEVLATAYQAQPYHHPTIGWRSDIENVPIEKLREFYDTYYWPNNATISIIGDFDPVQTLKWVARDYGNIPRAPHPIPEIYTTEPKQEGARRITLRRPGQLGAVLVAFKGPKGLDQDAPALDVLAAILASGENSRLSRALTEKSMTISAGAEFLALRDPGVFTVSARLAPGVAHQQVEAALLDEIRSVKEKGVSAEEVNGALVKARTAYAYDRDGTAGIAAAISDCVSLGDWTYYISYLDKVARITPADVQRVAKTYLNEDQSTTGWFVPASAGR